MLLSWVKRILKVGYARNFHKESEQNCPSSAETLNLTIQWFSEDHDRGTVCSESASSEQTLLRPSKIVEERGKHVRRNHGF
jgi:hypothetical protein